jgi:integrase
MTGRPESDEWNIIDNDKESQYYGKNFRFDFSFITSETIKDIVKDYTWQNYKVGNIVLNTLYHYVNGYFYYFNNFANTRNIISLTELTNIDIECFISYLHTTISKERNKPLSSSFQRKCLYVLKNIIYWCQIHRPNDVPANEIFTGNEYIGANRKLKIDFIPDEVVAQINEALKTEENPYLKYGIIILQSTGMRIGDLLKLRIDCIKPHPISGYTIEWTQHKVRRNKAPMPVRTECVAAIENLIEITAEFRDEATANDKDTLMIHRPKTSGKSEQVCVPTTRTFGDWFRAFVKKHNIKEANGDYFHLTSHQFRRTLGTDMLSKGTNINVIQQVLGHSVPSVTQRFYADVKDKERAEVFSNIGIIGNINQIQSSAFDSISEFEWFKANKDKCVAGLCDGYCTKPVTDGNICPRLLKRQKCYTCSRYITTPEYLEAHRQHLANLERQMEDGAIYGEHYAEHFIPTIQVLKVIIERLEGLQDGN